MQSRRDSMLEAVSNTALGFVISVAVFAATSEAFNLRTSLAEDVAIVGIFTATSLLRQYLLRRLFNGRTVRARHKELAT